MEALRKALTDLAEQRGIDLAALAAKARDLPPRDDQLDPVIFRKQRNEDLFANPKRLPQKFAGASMEADTVDWRVDQWLTRHCGDPVEHAHLLLSGAPGTGKTWHGIALLKDLVQGEAEAGRSSSWRYVSHADVSRQMRRFNDPDNDPQQLLDELIDTKILMFDDLGTALNREYGLEWLVELIDQRWRAGGELVTIYATNLRLGELETAIDGRVASRLLDGENVIIMDGADRRRATTGVIE